MVCNKSSDGLDHHCTWLNTCIAATNYEAFYLLVCMETLHCLYQLTLGICLGTIWFSTDIQSHVHADWIPVIKGFIWCHNIACFTIGCAFFLLAAFHTYLICIGSGTYDFVLEHGDEGLCAKILTFPMFTFRNRTSVKNLKKSIRSKKVSCAAWSENPSRKGASPGCLTSGNWFETKRPGFCLVIPPSSCKGGSIPKPSESVSSNTVKRSGILVVKEVPKLQTEQFDENNGADGKAHMTHTRVTQSSICEKEAQKSGNDASSREEATTIQNEVKDVTNRGRTEPEPADEETLEEIQLSDSDRSSGRKR